MKNKLWKPMLAAFFLSAGLVINTERSYAVDNEYDTAVDALYATTYKDIFYNKTAGSPIEYEPGDGVDTATGHLTLRREDLYLEGTGGMDFSLTRYYNSNEASIGHPTVEHVEELDVENIKISFTGEDGKKHTFVVSADIFNNHADVLEDMFIEYEKDGVGEEDTIEDTQRTKIVDNSKYNVYGISSGWAYDFPWIETMTIKEGEESQWGEKPIYLHLGSKGSMAIATSADDETKTYTITGLEGYTYSDVKLEDIDKTVDGVKCRYLLRDKTGLRTYFNGDGVIVLQKDAHNNTIKYTYRDKIYFDTITDSVGREIVFTYGEETNGQRFLENVTVQGQKIQGGVSSKKIKYAISEKSYTPKNGKKIYGSVLDSATVDGSKEKYGYRTVETVVNTSGWRIAGKRADTNKSYLINSIQCDGCITHYEYRAGAIRGTRDAIEGMNRDVATQFYYVTREYEQDAETKKKANGIKYDYYQKQKGEKELVSFADFYDTEARQYGEEGLQHVTLVSTYNPKKHKDNKKVSDYTYKKDEIDFDTLHLKKKPKKNVRLYIYNTNKLPTNIVEDGSSKSETLYNYDNSEKGSLVVLETEKEYGKNRSKNPKVTKEGHTYDSYRNLLTCKKPAAYLTKNRGKESLYTATYTYQNAGNGYPIEDIPFSLCILDTEEEYISSNTKSRLLITVADNGIDYESIFEQRSVNGGNYETISKTDFKYDEEGNETQGKIYPSYSTDGAKEVVQNDYTYNKLGQQTQKAITLASVNNPSDNCTYTEEAVSYDSFGNELTYRDENDLTVKISYDSETGEETESVNAVGTEYESTSKKYTSTDNLKTMTQDEYNRVSIDIRDGFGNTIISKDEVEGTWTESVYDYESDTENPDIEVEETGRLLEKRIYSFEPNEEKFIINENGEIVPNFYIMGKGDVILSGSKYYYDAFGDEIGSAFFSNGELDAAHCTSWSFTKSETEVEEEQIITTDYTKELNPSAYQDGVDIDNYYNQFDGSVLSERITKTVTDAEGNTISETSTYQRGENISETVTLYEYDEFGMIIKEGITTRKYQDRKWLPAYETEKLYSYDEYGNVSQTEMKSKKQEEIKWQSQITKTDYDDQGNIIREYTPRGVKENYAVQYTYDILGRVIGSKIPLEREDGNINYQTTTTTYDTAGNVIAEEEQIDSDRVSKKEYTYDKLGNLVMVKSCQEGNAAQYVQYVYDSEGNKVRQFVGMTSPLTLAISEVPSDTDNISTTDNEKDTFKYAGKTYQIEISGKKKSDTIAETKYEYNKKNQLVALIDPEGRKESYSYDVNSNLTMTIDKNGNIIRNTYDYQNRLIKTVAQEKETEEETIHTYSYNAYGDVAIQDDTSFVYGDVSGQVTEEITGINKNKNIVKNYTYDSANNKSTFIVKVGNETTLSLQYSYDGASNLIFVMDEKGKEIIGYEYNVDGNLSTRNVLENGLTTSYSYNYQNYMTEMKNQTENAGIISEYQSKYLLNGQKSKETSTSLGENGEKSTKIENYTYDLLGRIIREIKTGSDDITYSYDSHNNRKEMTIGNQIIAYQYNKNDELLRTDTLNINTEKDSVVLYKNDKNGNQLATVNRYEMPGDQADEPYFDMDVTLGDNRLSDNIVSHYNALNQQTEVFAENYKVRFTYDAKGLRNSKTVNGETTIYVWDGQQLVLELSEGGKVQKRYIRGNDLVYMDKGNGTKKRYYVLNPHGDVMQLTDENGNTIKTYEYDSFGNEMEPDKKDDNPFRYCGEYYDKEIEEIYLRARYYQPAVGRFITKDIYLGEENEPLTLHLYIYIVGMME